MSIDMVFKITAIGILTAVADMVLKRAGREDIAQIVALAGLAIVIAMVLTTVTDLFTGIRTLFGTF